MLKNIEKSTRNIFPETSTYVCPKSLNGPPTCLLTYDRNNMNRHLDHFNLSKGKELKR